MSDTCTIPSNDVNNDIVDPICKFSLSDLSENNSIPTKNGKNMSSRKALIASSRALTFLQQHHCKVDGNRKGNVSSMEAPYGMYMVPSELKDQLCDKIAEDFSNGVYSALVMQHDPAKPTESIYADIDLHTSEMLPANEFARIRNELAMMFMDCLNKCFKNVSPNQKTMYVMSRRSEYYIKEKRNVVNSSAPVSNDYVYGIHFIVPDLRVDVAMRTKLYTYYVNVVEESNLLKPYGTARDIIDPRIIESSGIMYSLCSKAGKEPYVPISIVDNEMQEISFDIADIDFLKSLVRDTMCCISEKNDVAAEFAAQNPEQAPMWVISEDETQQCLTKSNMTIRTGPKPTIEPSIDYGRGTDIDIEEAKSLLDLLPVSAIADYDKWKDVVIVCARVGGDRLRQKCHEVCAKAENYHRESLESFYNNCLKKKYNKSIGTLKKIVCETNRPEYDKYIAAMKDFHKENSESGTTYSLASFAVSLLGDTFVCTNGQQTDSIWHFDERKHKWSNAGSYELLMRYLSNEFCNVYHQRIRELEEKVNSGACESKEKLMMKMDHIHKNIIDKLYNYQFLTTLVRHICVLICNPEFHSYLDEKANLVGFKNGVYDLDNREFRKGHPLDYISLSTNIDYIEYDENNPMTARLMKLLNDIHPKEENCEFWLKTMANSLHGRRMHQRLYFWIGNGSNGKSTLVDLTRKSFGDLVDVPHISLLTKPIQNNGGPNPLIVQLKGKRLLIFQEPEPNERLSTSFMKQLFGADSLKARNLHQKDYVMFKSQAAGVVCANERMEISATDFGTWRRVRQIPYTTEFCSKPTQPHQRMIDTSIEDDMDDMASPFMSLLIHVFNTYIFSDRANVKFKNFDEPEDVLIATENYQADCDMYADFIGDELMAGKPDENVHVKEMYLVFKDWFQQTNPGKKPVLEKEFRRKMGAKLNINPRELRWFGWKRASNLSSNDGHSHGFGGASF